MGVRHLDYVVQGVRFHPESILTEVGHDVFNNFLGSTLALWYSDIRLTSASHLLTRGTNQIINKMIPITSKTQRSGPAMKWRSRPSSHKTNRIIPIIKSKRNMLISFYLSILTFPSFVSLFFYKKTIQAMRPTTLTGPKISSYQYHRFIFTSGWNIGSPCPAHSLDDLFYSKF